jgi:hypothetical protein
LPTRQEMRDYGERYGVGILVVYLRADDYNTLVSGTADEVGSLSVDLDTVSVHELWPALYDDVTGGELSTFLKGTLDLRDTAQLCRFGLSLE